MEQPENAMAEQQPDKAPLTPKEEVSTESNPAQPTLSEETTAPLVTENLDTEENDESTEDCETEDESAGIVRDTTATCESIVEKLKEMDAKDPSEYNGEDIRRLRQHFSMLRKSAVAAALDEWIQTGHVAEDFVDEGAELEEEAQKLIASIKEKKTAWAQAEDDKKKQNLERKNQIIDEILALAADTDNVNRTFQQYRELQDEFNNLGDVPQTQETDVWKRFADAREKYSDNLKINKELRDYDFKKNLDLKMLLIAEAEKLIEEEDVVVAYRRLQELHNKWRQIGPVAKEIRDEIWEKFRTLSAEINKRHQAHFEERKAREQANEQGKTAICERIESLDFSNLNSFSAWDAMTKEILEAQAEWKKYGYASRKANNALFSRFRAVCDKFFTAKAEYYKKVRDELAKNLAEKIALCEKAESLKESTDWGKTAEEIVALQKEWKKIGAVAKKHSDNVWKRFQSACDYFFEQRKKAGSSTRRIENENLKAKREIIARLETVTAEMPKDEVVALLRESQTQWQSIGHVPYKEKDKIYEEFRGKLNEIREMFEIRESRARIEKFSASISEMEGDEQKINRERDKLLRALDAKRNELRTYENNLCFLSSKSKAGDSMLKEFSRKTDRLKTDIKEIEDKIKLLDEKTV